MLLFRIKSMGETSMPLFATLMPESDPTNLVMFFGRLHPAIVHLPIGFLVVLAVIWR